MKRALLAVLVVLSMAGVAGAACLPGSTPLDWNGCPVYFSCQTPPADGPYVTVQATWSTGRGNGTSVSSRNTPDHYYAYWGSMNYALVNDGLSAMVNFYSLPNSTLLQVYGYDFSMIPDASIIKGIAVVVEGRVRGKAAIDYLKLFSAPGVVITQNLAATPISLATTDTVYIIGGPTSNLGLALTPAMLKSPTFGVEVGAKSLQTNSVAYLDQVSVVVYYTCP